jgi:hypothetical protein
MADFANSFPDEKLYDLLGDRIEIVDTNGKSRFIQAVFDFKYEDEELGDTLSVKIPYINCIDSVAATLNRNHTIKYNGESYSIYNRNPVDTGITQLVLRSVRSI